MANSLAGRALGSLPSNAEKNPREELKAITIKIGKVIEPKIGKRERGTNLKTTGESGSIRD